MSESQISWVGLKVGGRAISYVGRARVQVAEPSQRQSEVWKTWTPMPIFEALSQIRIDDLTSGIHSNEMVLPDFQRDFVWEPSATCSLLVSIANEFPAGSILRARDSQHAFAIRQFQGAPNMAGGYTYLVLDGQQRLTSLYQALLGVGDSRFFVSVEGALADPELLSEEAIFAQLASKGSTQKLENDLKTQFDSKVIPVSALKRPGGFHGWKDKIRETVGFEEARQFVDAATQVYDKHLHFLLDYTFPVVTLNQSVSPAALCTIFETINMTGVKLSVFELLTARVWPLGINLREKWDEAVSANQILDEFDASPYAALQALSLLARGSLQKKTVLDLTRENFDDWWTVVIASMAKGYNMLRDDCGVVGRAWLPTPSIIAPLTAMNAVAETRGPRAGEDRKKIVKWLRCAMFGQRFEAAANTRAERDFRDVREWLGTDEVPDTVKNFRFEREVLFNTNKKSSPIYKSVMCLIVSDEPVARDFYTNEVISVQTIASGQVDDHHIFPVAFLRREKLISEKKLVDCILNKTLISSTTNVLISDNAPSRYLAEIDQSNSDTDSILERHMIPSGENSAIRQDDFERFMSDRADMILEAIDRVTRVD